VELHRPRLFALAYRLLGAASAAEETVRAAADRCESAELLGSAAVEARLTAEVVNLCRLRLDSEQAGRSGQWLPEPVPTAHGELGSLDSAEQRELVSLPTLTLLEHLSPAERAVFVLREAFGYAHPEIADILGLAEAESQRLYRIARRYVRGDRIRARTSAEQVRPVIERFLTAVGAGDRATVQRLLSADAVAVSDDAGAARLVGREQVARHLLGLLTASGASISFEEVNGVTAAVVRDAGAVLLVAVPEIAGDRVSAVRIVVDPDKLAYLARTGGAV
jgi:RNA polymerase sigma-70 factor (ECF subfamily)